MAITRLSSVTKTIINLIEQELASLGPDALVVTPFPPDDTASTPGQVHVNLLHLIETAEFRNSGSGLRMSSVPVQQLPMGLALQYVVNVARVDPAGVADDPQVLYDSQDNLGRIARALHDFPVITPTTRINNIDILDLELAEAGDSIELILRPAPLQETLSYWATQAQRLPQACLFLEARVVVLQPKPPQILPGVVLSVGNFVFPNFGPQLVDTSSILRFVPPVPPGNTDVAQVNASPARLAMFPGGQVGDPTVTAFDLAHPDIVDNDFITLTGTGLTPGKRFLLLRRNELKLKIDLDTPHLNNASWAFTVGSDALSFRFRQHVTVVSIEPPQNTSLPIGLVPGLYGARLVIEDDRFSGVPRPRSSNEIAFAVGPQIIAVGIDSPTEDNRYVLTIAGDYLVPLPASPSEPKPPEVVLAVGGKALTQVESAADLDDDSPGVDDAGQFFVDTGSVIRFLLPAGMRPGDPGAPSPTNPLPVLLQVNGVAAPPVWLTTADTP